MKKTPPQATSNLAQAHTSLLNDLRELDEMFGSDSSVAPLQAGERLAAIHTRISDHFGFEEQSGWLEALRKQTPRLDREASRLLEEHRELIRSLDTLIEEVEASNSLNDAFYEKVRHWIFRVRDHETREDELLERSVNEDLGSGD
jgi:hypothetical protein